MKWPMSRILIKTLHVNKITSIDSVKHISMLAIFFYFSNVKNTNHICSANEFHARDAEIYVNDYHNLWAHFLNGHRVKVFVVVENH